MEKVKVSYVKRWDDDGTCYRKGFDYLRQLEEIFNTSMDDESQEKGYLILLEELEK